MAPRLPHWDNGTYRVTSAHDTQYPYDPLNYPQEYPYKLSYQETTWNKDSEFWQNLKNKIWLQWLLASKKKEQIEKLFETRILNSDKISKMKYGYATVTARL